MTKSFKRSKKNSILGPFWDLSTQIWAKINFCGKKGLCQFLNIPIIYHGAKDQKKLMTHS